MKAQSIPLSKSSKKFMLYFRHLGFFSRPISRQQHCIKSLWDLPHGMEEENGHDVRHGGAGRRVAGLGLGGRGHRVDPQLGGHVLEAGRFFLGQH